jgi:hypothetical protein
MSGARCEVDGRSLARLGRVRIYDGRPDRVGVGRPQASSPDQSPASRRDGKFQGFSTSGNVCTRSLRHTSTLDIGATMFANVRTCRRNREDGMSARIDGT